VIKITLKSYNNKKYKNNKKKYLCLHCLQQLKISRLPITEDDEYTIYLCKCGWRNDFEEDFSSFDDHPIVFSRVIIDDDYSTQQCYPPVYQKDIQLLPEKTREAVIDFLENELAITYCKEKIEKKYTHILFSKHYKGYLEEKYNEKTLLQLIRPLNLHTIRVRREQTTEEQRKRWSDSIYQHLKSLDIKSYEEKIKKKLAYIKIAKFFKTIGDEEETKIDEKTETWLSNTFYQINDKTGFKEGDLFENEQELRDYLTVDSLKSLFPDNDFDQDELDDFFNFLTHNRKKLEKIDLRFIE
jgi:hypothetical protein